MEVDLHIHTIASDGTYTSEEIIKRAIDKNLKAIAITDHDNVDGLKEANEIAKKYNFEFVNGIEFSCSIEDKEVHILGYFLNLEDEIFLERIEKLLESRDLRNKKIIEKLNNSGIMINIEDVLKESTGRIIARPHFAKALIKKGYCSDMKESFDKYLAKGGIAYVPRFNCSPETVVKYLRENGAISSLAHPKLISQDDNYILRLISKLKDCGLNAIEAQYSSFTKSEINKYKTFAKKFNLLISGGSDFHGENRANVDIGQAGISYIQFEKLKNLQNKI